MPFMKAKGFTIIELIVVMAVIGILAAMVIPRMMATGAINARESAELVAADIRKTQDLAMADISSHTITFTSGNNSYVIDQGTANAQTVTLPTGVTINTTSTITFSTLGEPDAGATINVGGISISVSQKTGRVSIS